MKWVACRTGSWKLSPGRFEIIAARALAEIAARGGLVAELSAGARKDGAGKDFIVFPDTSVGGAIAVCHERADGEAALLGLRDVVEADPVDVDQAAGRHQVELHEVEKVGAARDEERAVTGGGLYCVAGIL